MKHRDRYRHNLDTAYDEILAKKSFDKDSNQVDVEQLKKQQVKHKETLQSGYILSDSIEI